MVSDRNQVILLPGRGDGTFGAPRVIADLASGNLAAGDLNHDGRLDLLVSSTEIEVFLGNGDGTFQSPIAAGFSAGAGVNIAVADFNGDGISDIASTNTIQSATTLQVALGKGNGTFGPPIDTTIATFDTVPEPFAVADFTGDGVLDVAFSNRSQILLFVGKGDGTFSAGPVSPAAGPIVLAADLNGDGRPDLVLGGGALIAIALNTGGGTFGPLAYYQNQYGAGGVAGDFRHLGRPDVVVAGDFYPNEGLGFFRAPRTFPVPAADAWYVATRDFNNDGELDAAVILGDLVAVYNGNGRGNFDAYRQSTYNFPNREAITLAAAADFNGDGKLDLALGASNYLNHGGEVAIVLGNGDGTFGAPAVVYKGSAVGSILTADFNRDGKMDMAIGLSGQILVLLGDSAGGFTPSASLSSASSAPATADFNGDGIPDLATGSDVYLGNGDGTFRHSFSLLDGGSVVLAADFNGDGLIDLVTADTSVQGFITFWPGLGDGTFGSPLSVVSDISLEVPVLAADLNGDGIPDIAAGTNMFFLGKGNGTFTQQTASTLPQPDTGSNMAAGDFNNDGRVDLLIVYNGQLLALLNTTR